MSALDVFDLAFAIAALFSTAIGELAVRKIDKRITDVVERHVIIGQIEYAIVVQATLVALLNIVSAVVLSLNVDTRFERTIGCIVIVAVLLSLVRLVTAHVKDYMNWDALSSLCIKAIPLLALGVRLWVAHWV